MNKRTHARTAIVIIAIAIAAIAAYQIADRAMMQGDYKLCLQIKEIHNQPTTSCEKFNPKNWSLF